MTISKIRTNTVGKIRTNKHCRKNPYKLLLYVMVHNINRLLSIFIYRYLYRYLLILFYGVNKFIYENTYDTSLTTIDVYGRRK